VLLWQGFWAALAVASNLQACIQLAFISGINWEQEVRRSASLLRAAAGKRAAMWGGDDNGYRDKDASGDSSDADMEGGASKSAPVTVHQGRAATTTGLRSRGSHPSTSSSIAEHTDSSTEGPSLLVVVDGAADKAAFASAARGGGMDVGNGAHGTVGGSSTQRGVGHDDGGGGGRNGLPTRDCRASYGQERRSLSDEVTNAHTGLVPAQREPSKGSTAAAAVGELLGRSSMQCHVGAGAVMAPQQASQEQQLTSPVGTPPRPGMAPRADGPAAAAAAASSGTASTGVALGLPSRCSLK
jgi:hypothetical protein